MEKYSQSLDINQIYERCHILHSMVLVSSKKEWNKSNCVKRFDKLLGNARQYESKDFIKTKTEHKKRVSILIDIADIGATSGLKPFTIDAYINIIEECYSVYWLSNRSEYEVNIIDRTNMEKYVGIVHRAILDSGVRRYQAQVLMLSAQLCILEKYDEARELYGSFDKKQLIHFNNIVKNYYSFVEDIFKIVVV